MNYTVNLTDGWNMTNITLDDVPIKSSSSYSCDSGIALVRYIAEVWIVMPIACFGIVGNIMAFIVLWNQKKLTTTIILQWLALVDTLILVSVMPLRSLYISYVCAGIPVNYKETWKFLYRWIYPCMYALRMIDTWLITLLTLDRWIAVCRPLHAPRLCTASSTYKRLTILVISAILFSLPRFFENTQYGFFDVGHTVLNDFRWYIITYQVVLFFLFMYLIPMIMLVVFNVQLIRALRIANASFAGRRHSQASSSTQHRGITVIVITVVTTCVLCNILAMISHFMTSLEKFVDDDAANSIEDHRRPLAIVSNIMVVLNSAINFALYCFSSKNFRQVTAKTFCCKRRCNGYTPVMRSTSMHSSNTYDTYVPSRLSNGTSKENGIKLQRLLKPSQS